MSRRAERVAEAIRREASLLIKDELRDPRVGFVTVTKATITADLRNAVIYYTVLGDDKTKELAKKGLQSALRFLRMEIAHKLKLRYVPELRLRRDDTFDYAQRIDEVLKKIKDEEREDKNAE